MNTPPVVSPIPLLVCAFCPVQVRGQVVGAASSLTGMVCPACARPMFTPDQILNLVDTRSWGELEQERAIPRSREAA